MTGTEMISAFKIYYDRVTSLSAPGYKESQILLFLNNAQDQFIKDRTFGQNFKQPAFEDNQKRSTDILPLTTREHITFGFISPEPLYGSGGYSFNKSAVAGNRVLYTTEVEASVRRTSPEVNDEYILCHKIKSENIGRFIPSAINKTHFFNPKWTEDANKYYIINDSYTTAMDDVRLNVIRKPYPILSTSVDYTGTYTSGVMSLNMSVHQEIVDIAVRQAEQAISDPRWQTKVSEEQINTQ